MDGGAWWAAAHGVAKSRTRLSDFTFTFHFHALEKEMATHSSVLAWRIPGTGKPGRLPSMGSHRVGHDWSDLAAAAAAQMKSNPFQKWQWPFFAEKKKLVLKFMCNYKKPEIAKTILKKKIGRFHYPVSVSTQPMYHGNSNQDCVVLR